MDHGTTRAAAMQRVRVRAAGPRPGVRAGVAQRMQVGTGGVWGLAKGMRGKVLVAQAAAAADGAAGRRGEEARSVAGVGVAGKRNRPRMMRRSGTPMGTAAPRAACWRSRSSATGRAGGMRQPAASSGNSRNAARGRRGMAHASVSIGRKNQLVGSRPR
jgi:hypothetical protein